MIAGLFEAAAMIIHEIRRLIREDAVELDIPETQRQIDLLDSQLSDLRRERERLNEALERANH